MINVYPLSVLVLGILYAYLVSVYLFPVGDPYFACHIAGSSHPSDGGVPREAIGCADGEDFVDYPGA